MLLILIYFCLFHTFLNIPYKKVVKAKLFSCYQLSSHLLMELPYCAKLSERVGTPGSYSPLNKRWAVSHITSQCCRRYEFSNL